MDSLIQEANFLHDEKKVAQEFENNVKIWKENNKETIAAGQITSGFQTLGKKLMESKCPVFRTEGWKQAESVFHVLEDLAGSQIVMGTIHPDEFHEVLYKLMIDWFQDGPTTLSLHLINCLHKHRHLGMKEYTTSQKDEKLNKLLRAFTSPIIKKEDTPNKEFYSAYRTSFEIFFNDSFEDSQLMMEDSMKLMMDFAFHLHLDYIHLDDESVNQLDKLAKRIHRNYGDKWKIFSDIPRLKSYIQKFSSVAKTSGFPRNKVIADFIYESLAKITKMLHIQKTGLVETYADDMFDLMEVISQAQGDSENVVRVFSAAVVFFDQRGGNKNNPAVFKTVAPRFKSLITILDVAFLKDTRFVSDIMTILENSYGDNNELTVQWLSLSIPLMRRQTLKTLNACRNVLSKYDKIKWKEHDQFVKDLLSVFKEIEVPMDNSRESCMKEVTSSISYLMRGLKRARIHKNYAETLMYLSIHLVELRAKELFEAAEDVGEHIEIDVKEKKDSVMEVMGRLLVILKDEDLPWNTCWPLQRAVCDIMESIFKCVKDGKIFSEDDLKLFTSMCVTCLEKDAVDPDSGNMSHHFLISLKILGNLIPWYGSIKKVDLANELIPLFIRLLDDEDTTVQDYPGIYLTNIATQDVAILVPYFDEILKIYLDKEISNLLPLLGKVYSTADVSLKACFQELLTHMLESSDKKVRGQLPIIFWTASKKEAELFTDDNMKNLIQLAKLDKDFQGLFLQTITDVCKRRPGKLIKHRDLFMKKNEWNPNFMCILNDILSTLALHDNTISDEIVDHFINIVSTESDKGVLLTALNAIRLIGFKYPDVIKPKRERIQNLQIIDADAQGQKQNIIDIIDEKTPEDVKKQLSVQQEAVSGLVEKVEDVEGTVASVVGEMEDQRRDLDNVKHDVTEQAQRLDQVEEDVEDTVKKVEEIDNKTLSHAPYWSRDISKLLNPATEHDWRLLSSRLGYSNADIRGWAQQADPCMAMLNEWYATRKTSEATHAILTHLQEMNRDDAALIVENAMKKAEAVVEDEDFEYASPPEIFISYQWGHQEEVNLLHRHLGMAGYDCWMDIGQMGGGDKLFEKIDSGMRAAKLVISCVTTKYAKSPNCNREVNLAVGVKKPIIPLLFENCTWPPPGSMGPIFSESLYVQFFQTGQDETKDNRFWPVEKFQELLMQLSVNGLTPDEGRIETIYRNWWMPLEEEINIDKSKTRDGGKQVEVAKSGNNPESEEIPEVFISYQWGKQKNIIKLYQRLTSLGFSCWLDIKQMGGGDSLYDKIDKGIRGCKVVVSCVTKKYAMSPNCRREVSLTDALKKPLLPLLLEEMTWPPTGPMSMILTQLLYIGFQQELSHTNWVGPQFDELINKINHHLNRPMTQKSISPNPVNESSQPEEKSSNTQESTKPNSDSKPETSESGLNEGQPEIPPENKPASPKGIASERNKPSNSDNNTSTDVGQDVKPQPAPVSDPPPPKPPAAAPPTTPNKKSKSCSIL